ncbi:MAG: hypothetical protein ACAI34_03785 [Verrucomicrobium sp.]|nr:hypothetical protein [Verrucomicrobium sp.]
MSRSLPESDWKKFRQIHAAALQRFSQQKLDHLAKLAAREGKTPQEKLLSTFEFAHKTQSEMAAIFDDMRRSTAFMYLLRMRAENLIAPEEWDSLSDETRKHITDLKGVLY